MVQLDLQGVVKCCFISFVKQHACLRVIEKVTCILKLAIFIIFCKGIVDQVQEFLCIINVLNLFWHINLCQNILKCRSVVYSWVQAGSEEKNHYSLSFGREE